MNRFAMRRVCLVVILGVIPLVGVAQDREADEWKKLQGAWTVTAAEQNGRPNDAIKGGVLTIASQAFSLKTAAGNEFKGQLRINAATTPLQLDLVHEGGPVWQAIYTVTGDVFRLNYSEAGDGRERPTLFATSSGGPGTIVVMRRNK